MHTLDTLASSVDPLDTEILDITGGMMPVWTLFCRLFPEYCYPMI